MGPRLAAMTSSRCGRWSEPDRISTDIFVSHASFVCTCSALTACTPPWTTHLGKQLLPFDTSIYLVYKSLSAMTSITHEISHPEPGPHVLCF